MPDNISEKDEKEFFNLSMNEFSKYVYKDKWNTQNIYPKILKRNSKI